jgi:DNA modification methylase
MNRSVKHPAQYSTRILDVLEEIADGITGRVLDPFAGMGNIHQIARADLCTIGIELEQEWAEQHPDTLHGDATRLPFKDQSFDAIITSPVYGNRMSDSHNAVERCQKCKGEGCVKCGHSGRREYKRLTYTHTLGRQLADNNAGKLQWGEKYKDLHFKAWAEAVRVLKPQGLFVLNVSDHIRKGKVIPVTAWHTATLKNLGIEWLYRVPVETPRMRFGQNGDVRVTHEDVYVGKANGFFY